MKISLLDFLPSLQPKSILVLVIVVFVTGNLQADLSDGLVGYWPFNGNANDETGDAINLILHNDGTMVGTGQECLG